MKYSQRLGIVACLCLIGVCYMPWSFIASMNVTVTGMAVRVDNFGRPGLMNVIMNVLLIIFFLIPKIWAKRFNVFFAAFNLAWSFRNYLLVTSCDGGDCPQKRTGIFLLLILSLFIQVMTFFPSIKIKEES